MHDTFGGVVRGGGGVCAFFAKWKKARYLKDTVGGGGEWAPLSVSYSRCSSSSFIIGDILRPFNEKFPGTVICGTGFGSDWKFFN